MKRFLFVISFFVLIGCSNNTEETEIDHGESIPSNGEVAKEEVKEPSEKKEEPVGEEENKEAIGDLAKYFKPHQSTATFLGDGNEFASYTEKTTWLSDKYVATIVDNGGVTMLNIYKIGDEQIEKLLSEPLEVPADEVTFPQIEQLESMQPIETYLAKPIEVGTTFGKWTIVETGITLETPYETFENVFVIEETGEDYINRKYFVESYGDIKSEYIMQVDEDEKFIVTSVLERMN